ncbi:hypothetical protein C7974DRAFT_29367 [Boeremia exigua]|uniref:uncharacterized protein n=1 Tax=Boeremia exigua TaxID=749465 RepID=UPI001E8D7EC9|nr:uncharacterized protein C7974DRAFT_29367 [Boeremia exigua]KAH6644872.1 hypothetical protein C7974DRAFT_29367 [Boeremia exigua]
MTSACHNMHVAWQSHHHHRLSQQGQVTPHCAGARSIRQGFGLGSGVVVPCLNAGSQPHSYDHGRKSRSGLESVYRLLHPDVSQHGQRACRRRVQDLMHESCRVETYQRLTATSARPDYCTLETQLLRTACRAKRNCRTLGDRHSRFSRSMVARYGGPLNDNDPGSLNVQGSRPCLLQPAQTARSTSRRHAYTKHLNPRLSRRANGPGLYANLIVLASLPGREC